MSWRTVVVATRCKLDLKMGYMVIRGEETQRIFLDEVAVLLIENPAVAMTGCLLEALVERKIKVIFCDSHRNPAAELAPYYGAHDCARKVKQQCGWTPEMKGIIWTTIISEKISNQSRILAELGKQREALKLEEYAGEILFQDASNREGHAAKVYFNALFGKSFSREAETPINASLNYGYGIILSAFNREIVSSGYITQLGLHHENVYNKFNLSSDLMEPYRPIVDRIVAKKMPERFTKQERYELIDLLNLPVSIAGKENTVLNSIGLYVRSIFSALETGAVDQIVFAEI